MRILHVATHSAVIRGGAVQACRMARALAARGHEVLLVANATDADDESAGDANAEGWRRRLGESIDLRILPLATPEGRAGLGALVDEWRPDIVHAHRDAALLAVAEVARTRPDFVFVGQRGTTTPPPPEPRAVFASERIDAVVCVADAVRKVVLEQADVAERKVRTVYGSVDLDEFAPGRKGGKIREKLGLPSNAFVVGSLSSFREAKGFRTLLRAMRAAVRRDATLRFVFLGTGLEKEVLPKARKYGIENYCHFVGHQPDVAAWLSAMDCTVVAATEREGLSGVLRESLACGVPVISTATDGNPEIVRHEKTGLLVEPGNRRAMARAFVWAADNPKEMRAMSRAGREWVRSHCSPLAQATALEAIYREHLAHRRPAALAAEVAARRPALLAPGLGSGRDEESATWPWIIEGIGVIALAALIPPVRAVLVSLDVAIARGANGLVGISQAFDQFVGGLNSQDGDLLVVLALSLLLGGHIIRAKDDREFARRLAFWLWTGTLFFLLYQLQRLFQGLFERDSPSRELPGWQSLNRMYDDMHAKVANKRSFPSGHASGYYFLAFMALRRYRKMGMFLLAIALVLPTTRIVSGAHWPSDIFLGSVPLMALAAALASETGLAGIVGAIERACTPAVAALLRYYRIEGGVRIRATLRRFTHPRKKKKKQKQ